MKILIDLETRSRADLKKVGAYVYAKDPSTYILCAAFTFVDINNEILTWTRNHGPKDLKRMKSWLLDTEDREILAWNAQFERLILKHCWELDLPIERFECIANQARACGVPGKLDDAPKLLGGRIKKNWKGAQLIRACCIPDKHGKFHDERLEELYDYCEQDVRTERALWKQMPVTDEQAWHDWCVSERINDRGISIDRKWCRKALTYKEEIERTTHAMCRDLTEHEIHSPLSYNFSLWIYDRMTPQVRLMVPITKKTERPSFTKEVRALLMDADDEWKGDKPLLSDTVRIGIELIDSARLSISSKYETMLARTSHKDTRLRGSYISNGASGTGRFSSVGAQIHNLKRGHVDGITEIIRAPENSELAPSELLSRMLRQTLVAASHHHLVGCDWSAIEARVLPWLAGDEYVLDVFHMVDADPTLPDIYQRAASAIWGRGASEISDSERQAGKVLVLACGYQGGAAAVQRMARNFGLVWSDAYAGELKNRWRADNQWCVEFWDDLNRAAIIAIKHGHFSATGRIHFHCDKYIGGVHTLRMTLPCGRHLYYPHVEIIEGKFGGEQIAYRAASKKPAAGQPWPQWTTYGGALANNATQGVAASLLRSALITTEAAELNVVAHTHDSICVECGDGDVPVVEPELAKLMLKTPEWAEGLPLACETWKGKRFKG